MKEKPRVLFLCTGHPERSEMAEGFLRQLAGDKLTPVSAALEPAPVSPLAVDAMKEVGIDISKQQVADVPTAFKERFAFAVGVGDQTKGAMSGLSVRFSAISLESRGPCRSPRLTSGAPGDVSPCPRPDSWPRARIRGSDPDRFYALRGP
jgi:hypothetical protein